MNASVSNETTTETPTTTGIDMLATYWLAANGMKEWVDAYLLYYPFPDPRRNRQVALNRLNLAL